MTTNAEPTRPGTAENVVPLPPALAVVPKPKPAARQSRFAILEYENNSGTKSWRVSGYRRTGERVRENFSELLKAQTRQLELETEFLTAQPPRTAIRATHLTDVQVAIAEAAFLRMGPGNDAELSLAVDHWINHGRQTAVKESPRLDDAITKFGEWLDTEAKFRARTKANLKNRLSVFQNSVPNIRVADVTPEVIDRFLDKRKVSGSTKDNDRRAVSRFFSWALDRKRRWIALNPCRAVKVEKDESGAPAILSLDECEGILKAAQSHRRGRLLPYAAVCLFGGLRPFEAARLDWTHVNLTDGEIRLEADMTKTKMPRVVAICPTLKAWLKTCEGKPFYPANWRKDFDAIKRKAGFGNSKKNPKLKEWPEDVLRHTAISHYFRLTGSYGKSAEQFGNSEGIIKQHYQGRVSSADTEQFYAILPKGKRQTKKGNRK